MIIFERLGGWGLGNSFFQIAATLAIARNNNTTYAFPNDCYFKRKRYNSNILFKNNLPWIDFKNITKQGYDRWGHGGPGFVQPPITDKLLIIDGFFQSEKYFKNYREEILKLFELKDEYKLYVQNKYKSLIEDDSCVLHVRRKDYATARELIILDISYYVKATEIIGKDKHFVIFSDDIEWCKNNFEFLSKKTFIDEHNDLLEIYLMTLFKNHIIANSTFSWWGAWMSNNLNVWMPNPKNNWFSEAYYNENYEANYEDLICLGWNII